jgi:signal peptidase I
MPAPENQSNTLSDFRIHIYNCVKIVVILAACAFAVKFVFLDTIAIKTDQMSPALMRGDRTLILRTPFIKPFNRLLTPGRGVPLIVKHPLMGKNYACLRVAGVAGDSIAISHGSYRIINSPDKTFGTPMAAGEDLPPDYSPRDSMQPFHIPLKGELLQLDSLGLRDFFFAVAIIKLENLHKTYRVKARLSVEGVIDKGKALTDFYLYKGLLDTIPEKYDFDWFFWDRLKEYCNNTFKGKDFSLDIGLFEGNERVTNYIVGKSIIFLMADDWRKGFDSRYFGPIPVSLIKGRPIVVLWSWAKDASWPGIFRIGRILKIVK